MLVSEAEPLLAEYDEYVASGRIKPVLFDRGMYHFMPKLDEVHWVKEGIDFKGIAHYSKDHVDDPEELEILLLLQFKRDIVDCGGSSLSNIDVSRYAGFRDHDYSRPIVRIKTIESFEKGIGSRLIQEIADLTNASTIFLTPCSTANGFYRRAGFEYSQLYSPDVSTPILVKNF